MSSISQRITFLRKNMHLSQKYVANFLGINPATYIQMENGKGRITAEVVSSLSELYKVSADILLNGMKQITPISNFDKLSENDQSEITNLLIKKKS